MGTQRIKALRYDFSSQATRKQTIDTVCEYVYFNLAYCGIYCKDEDMRSDFVVWLYPKLADIIAGYKSDRSIFSTYLRMAVSYNWKLFMRRRQERASYSTIAQEEQSNEVKYMHDEQDAHDNYEMYAARSVPAYTVSPKTEKFLHDTIKWKKREEAVYRRYFLELACKSCFCIDEQLMMRVAEYIHIPVDTLRSLIETFKTVSCKRDAQCRILKAKRDFYYLRYKSASIQLEAIDSSHASVIRRLKTQKTYSYTRWQHYLARVEHYNRSPSNRTLAKQLGLSRSTIDNDFATLKKTMSV